MSEPCDVCGKPATVVRPATPKRGKYSGFERAVYCDYDAKRGLGWGDTFHRLEEDEND